MSANIVLVAACALVDADGRVLLAQRPEGKSMAGLWEFPGGKVEAGERPEQTLIRELKEELGITVNEACLAPLTFASHAYADFHLLMPLYVCRKWEGTVTPTEGQQLAWVRPNRLRDYDMPPADIPLIPHLQALYVIPGAKRNGQEREKKCPCAVSLRAQLVRRFLRAQEGATAIEYAMIAAGISIAIVATVTTLGSAIKKNFYDKLGSDVLTPGLHRSGFSPVGISCAPSASASRCAAEPGLSGFCWLSCGAQPDNQTISKVARTRPSASAKRSP